MQGEARRESRTSPGGIETAQNADAYRDRHSDEDEIEAEVRFEQTTDRRRGFHQLDTDDAQADPDDSTEQSEQGGLEQNHPDDSAASPSQGKQDGDLLLPLEYAHEHGIRDAKHADYHRQQGSAPAHRVDHTVTLGVNQMFTGRLGVPFRNQPGHFIAKLPDSGLVHPGIAAHVN